MLYGIRTVDAQEVVLLYVDKIYQREGGGKALVDAFLERCDPTRPIEVGVIDDNIDAQEFYKKIRV